MLANPLNHIPAIITLAQSSSGYISVLSRLIMHYHNTTCTVKGVLLVVTIIARPCGSARFAFQLVVLALWPPTVLARTHFVIGLVSSRGCRFQQLMEREKKPLYTPARECRQLRSVAAADVMEYLAAREPDILSVTAGLKERKPLLLLVDNTHT